MKGLRHKGITKATVADTATMRTKAPPEHQQLAVALPAPDVHSCVPSMPKRL